MPLRISRNKRFSSRRSCSSAAIIGHNDDLLTEILVLLPAKCVVRFKSVSKHWQFLISSKYFTRLHIQNHRHRRAETQHSFILSVRGRAQLFFCHPDNRRLVRVGLPPIIKNQQFEYVRLLQSMNGLLLLSLKFPGVNRISYVVFNPATKKYRLIDLDGHQPVKLALVFDPCKSEHYKLIMETSATPRFFVYDSATHKWNDGQDSPFKGVAIFRAMLYNLIVYATRRGEKSPESLRIPEIEAYDTYMFDSNGHLNFLQLKSLHEENKLCFRVGVTIDDDIYKWEICKNAIVDFGSGTVELLGMIREERIEDSAFLFHVPGRLLIYKFSDDDREMEVMVDYRSDYFYEI